jgi:NAD-dependent DNA ligase
VRTIESIPLKLIGDAAGSKLEKARSQGEMVLNEAELEELLASQSLTTDKHRLMRC